MPRPKKMKGLLHWEMRFRRQDHPHEQGEIVALHDFDGGTQSETSIVQLRRSSGTLGNKIEVLASLDGQCPQHILSGDRTPRLLCRTQSIGDRFCCESSGYTHARGPIENYRNVASEFFFKARHSEGIDIHGTEFQDLIPTRISHHGAVKSDDFVNPF